MAVTRQLFGGFVAGAAIGAAAANANGYYYGSGYGCEPYAYEPAYVAPEPVYTSPGYYRSGHDLQLALQFGLRHQLHWAVAGAPSPGP